MASPLLERLDRHFAAGARMRGERYFRQGRVLLRRLEEKVIAAEVRGTRRYDVSLRYVDPSRTWEIFCSCPAFAGGVPCKHLWATIEAARAGPDAGAALPHPDRSEPASAGIRPAAPRPPKANLELAERILARLHARGRHDEDEADPEFLPDSFEDSRGRARGARVRRAERDPLESPLGELRALVARSTHGRGRPGVPERRLRYVLAIEHTPFGSHALVHVLSQRELKRGGWSEPKSFQVRDQDEHDDLSSDDRALVALLRGGTGEGMWTYGGASSFSLPSGLSSIVLPRMAATGRLHLALDGASVGGPIAWDPGERWRFGVSLARAAEGGGLTIEGFLSRGDERMPLSSPVALMEGGLVVMQDRLAQVDLEDAWECTSILRRSGRIDVPPSRVPEALDLLLHLPGNPRIDAPGIVDEIEERPRPCLLLDPPRPISGARSTPGDLLGRVEFEYGTLRVGHHDGDGLRVQGDSLVRVSRDATAEREAIERLVALGARVEAGGESVPEVRIATPDLPTLVTTLTAEGWIVEADGQPCRSGGSLRLSIRSGIDWFDLEGAADFGGARATLPDILLAVRDGSRIVRLSDGSFGMLPETWLAGWGLAGVGEEHQEALRFHRSQAWVLDLLLAERGEADVDAAFARARAALRRFERFEPAREPEGFQGELRTYQREGLGWLRLLRELGLGGCLADDMGLGKTVQVLALLAERPEGKRRPSIVVAPRSVVFNWLREAERFAPELSIVAHHGPGRAQNEKDLARHDLVVTTYGTLRRDVEMLARIPFAHAILDEAQMIKNAGSQAAKAARLLRAEHRLVLTGTPVENHIDDLWSLFEFLNPGMLGRSKVFRELVAPRRESDEPRRGDAGAPGGSNGPAVEPIRHLARALRPFLLRRTKEQVLADLPPKIEQVIACDLEGEERRRYEKLRDYYRQSLLTRVEEEGMERSRMHVLEALLRLRQAACHPGLIDPARTGERSAKLDALLPMLEEVRESGHKALVFSQFTSFLAIVRERLDSAGVVYEYLDGRTRKREEKVRRFQEDAGCTLFLISLKAGGFGLNLAAADYVFLLDPWWNPAVERQAIDRTHRIGQTRKVNAYRLVARGTIEEKVLELQERKRELADAILGAAEGTLRDLTREDLERLLS